MARRQRRRAAVGRAAPDAGRPPSPASTAGRGGGSSSAPSGARPARWRGSGCRAIHGGSETRSSTCGRLGPQMAASLQQALLDREARQDARTGAADRRCSNAACSRPTAPACEQGGRLAVILCGLDRFKRMNDTTATPPATGRRGGGRGAGQEKRAGDLLAHFGGEESPCSWGDDGSTALAVAERCGCGGRRQIAVDGERGEDPVTLSAGAAAFPELHVKLAGELPSSPTRRSPRPSAAAATAACSTSARALRRARRQRRRGRGAAAKDRAAASLRVTVDVPPRVRDSRAQRPYCRVGPRSPSARVAPRAEAAHDDADDHALAPLPREPSAPAVPPPPRLRPFAGGGGRDPRALLAEIRAARLEPAGAVEFVD